MQWNQINKRKLIIEWGSLFVAILALVVSLYSSYYLQKSDQQFQLSLLKMNTLQNAVPKVASYHFFSISITQRMHLIQYNLMPNSDFTEEINDNYKNARIMWGSVEHVLNDNSELRNIINEIDNMFSEDLEIRVFDRSQKQKIFSLMLQFPITLSEEINDTLKFLAREVSLEES